MSSKAGRHFNRNQGYVYIARANNGHIKVGGTSSVRRRILDHGRRYGSVRLVVMIKSERFMILEKFLHIQIAEHRVRGTNEWYKHEPDVVRTIVDFLKMHGEIFGAYEIFFTSPKSQSQ